jgi:hypothetical protein
MTLAEFAALGELIGGVAVVVSLVYLGVQVRQNTRGVRGSTLQLNTDFWGEHFMHLAEPELTAAYVSGMSGRPDIKPLHYTQFFFICRATFVGFENQYFQYRQGVLDPATYAGYERSIESQLLAFRGFRLWWTQSRGVFSPPFVDHVDAMIERTPELDPGAFLAEWQELARSREAAAAHIGARVES